MLTKQVVIGAAVFTTVIHRARYRVSGELDDRILEVVTNLPGVVSDKEIDIYTNVKQLMQINEDVKEAIRIMNDDFAEVEDKINPYTLFAVETIHHEEQGNYGY